MFLVIAISSFLSAAIAADDASEFPPDPGLYRLTQSLGYELWIASTMIAALVPWATAAVVLQTRVLPKWFAWFSVVVGVVCLFAVFFIPIFVYLAWILVAAILFVTRSTTEVVERPNARAGPSAPLV